MPGKLSMLERTGGEGFSAIPKIAMKLLASGKITPRDFCVFAVYVDRAGDRDTLQIGASKVGRLAGGISRFTVARSIETLVSVGLLHLEEHKLGHAPVWRIIRSGSLAARQAFKYENVKLGKSTPERGVANPPQGSGKSATPFKKCSKKITKEARRKEVCDLLSPDCDIKSRRVSRLQHGPKVNGVGSHHSEQDEHEGGFRSLTEEEVARLGLNPASPERGA